MSRPKIETNGCARCSDEQEVQKGWFVSFPNLDEDPALHSRLDEDPGASTADIMARVCQHPATIRDPLR